MMMAPTAPPTPTPLLLLVSASMMPATTQSYDAGVSGSLGWRWKCVSSCGHIRRALSCMCMWVIVAVVVQSISHCRAELMHCPWHRHDNNSSEFGFWVHRFAVRPYEVSVRKDHYTKLFDDNYLLHIFNTND